MKRSSQIDLTVTRLPTAIATSGEERGTLTARFVSGATPLTAGLSGNRQAWVPALYTAPSRLQVTSLGHRFLVGSATGNQTRITGMALEGRDRGEFTVTWDPYGSATCADPADPLCLNRVMPSAGAEIYEVTRTGPTCRTADHEAAVRISVQECVTQTSCGPTDDWRAAPDLIVDLAARAGDECP